MPSIAPSTCLISLITPYSSAASPTIPIWTRPARSTAARMPRTASRKNSLGLERYGAAAGIAGVTAATCASAGFR
jgi:hypothetical protein